jgi:rfaE bifunctional protein nucleotidyltransferase chain/domain
MGKVYTQNELAQERLKWKQHHQKVVFTNGVFDILHRGHAEYLNAARQLGDILIVGVNSDASVRKIKGPLRPIVPDHDRAFLLSQFAAVDGVALFDEETPFAIISLLLPDILVKGADYSLDTIVGRDVVEAAGGIVQTIPFVPNRSTTNIVDIIVSRFSKQQE